MKVLIWYILKRKRKRKRRNGYGTEMMGSVGLWRKKREGEGMRLTPQQWRVVQVDGSHWFPIG